MERGEPSLVPEWLRSTTSGGTGTSSSSHHLASLQADGPVLALPKRNISSKSMGNSDALHSSLLDRSSSSNSRRTSSSNGSTKHDRNSYSRSYHSFNRSQREKDKERLTITDTWDLEYSDPLRSIIPGRTERSLRRSQSMVSKRQGEVGNGTYFAGTSVTGGIHKVSFERDFPHLGSDERPKTPDIVTVSSPGLSRSIRIMPTSNSPLIGSEGWTSALAEVPTSVSGGSSNATLGVGSTSNGLNMAEALVQTPARTQNIAQSSAQSQRDELAIAQSKKLIPMTPSLPKPLVNQSDKLKPKTQGRSSEVMGIPKNGVHQLSPVQLGVQSTRGGTSSRVDAPKSPGKLIVLKPVIKDGQSQTTISGNRAPPNSHSDTAPSVVSAPLKRRGNPRAPSGEWRAPGLGSSLVKGGGAEKRNFQSRSDFFNMMRKKSMNSTSSLATDSGSTDADMADKPDKFKEVSCVQTSAENGGEVKCNGETCTASESCEDENAGIYPNEEEKAFLRSLGWEENAGDDEALTEEEINAFYQEVWRLRATSKWCRDRWPKSLSHFENGGTYPNAASSEPNTSASPN